MRMPRGGRLFLATCLGSAFVVVLYFHSITKPGENALILQKSSPIEALNMFFKLTTVLLTMEREVTKKKVNQQG